jgi:hypothetical protein
MCGVNRLEHRGGTKGVCEVDKVRGLEMIWSGIGRSSHQVESTSMPMIMPGYVSYCSIRNA